MSQQGHGRTEHHDKSDVRMGRTIRTPRSLEGFSRRLHLHPDVVDDISSWAGHAQLGGLHGSLVAHSNEKSFLDKYAEALVARHLLNAGLTFKMDVPTPNGRTADFEVLVDCYRFFLHIKRLDCLRSEAARKPLNAHVRYLERIERPYVVHVRWDEDATDEHMQQLVEGASRFLKRGHVGDEFVARDDDRQEIGGVRIMAPWDGDHIRLVHGEGELIDDLPRIQKLMRKAARQFMPGAVNVVLLCSEHQETERDFETALLGSHVERWDRRPPKGQRIAHGRAADGFWHGNRYQDWQGAGWFRFNPECAHLHGRLWVRAYMGVPTQVIATMVKLFSSPTCDE